LLPHGIDRPQIEIVRKLLSQLSLLGITLDGAPEFHAALIFLLPTGVFGGMGSGRGGGVLL
jgi:hypothetical protein